MTDNHKWRLILDPPAKGAWNMAVDEALLETAGSAESGITLRIFGWEPACLSLGHAQQVKEVDFERLHQRRWDLVRRPTGGRAILHIDEITYSITGNVNHPIFQGGILPSYQRIAKALLCFLESIGLHPSSQEDNESCLPNLNPICFEVPSNYEITISNRKIIGSAQARRKNGVLQHGTVPLFGDIARITDVLAYDSAEQREKAASSVYTRATTLGKELGYRISYADAVQSFITAFQTVHRIEFSKKTLTDHERELAGQICKEKYANPDWTNRV